MKVNVTLRYLAEDLVNVTREISIDPGCTAGELSARVVREEEQKEGIRFSGASIVVLINGKVAAPERLLKEGDVIRIVPVAAGG